MKNKIFFGITAIVLMITSACGPEPEPTLSVVEIQGTAVSLAMTSIAITKASLPTNTPLPTPIPTLAESPTPFPTLAPVILPTSAAAIPSPTEVNPCNEPPPIDPKGTTVQIRFENRSKGKAILSLGMLEENDQGECGTYSFTIAANTKPAVTVLSGCYWAFAWIEGREPSNARSTYDICLTDTNQTRVLSITPETIGWD